MHGGNTENTEVIGKELMIMATLLSSLPMHKK